MANYTAAGIKALREKTGAGMLDVKNALDEADGNAEKALEIIRVKGLKGVAKREGRSASDGLVAATVTDTADGQVGTLIELNSETDFVAKNLSYIALGDKLLAAAVAACCSALAALRASICAGSFSASASSRVTRESRSPTAFAVAALAFAVAIAALASSGDIACAATRDSSSVTSAARFSNRRT